MKRDDPAQKQASDSALLDQLPPPDRALVERVLAHHPALAPMDAIRDLKAAGGL